MSAEVPAAAVVVSTYNRAHLLPRLVAALCAQRDAQRLEIVLVDNASTDATAVVIRQLAEQSSVPIRSASRTVNTGPAAARNLGWRSTAAPLVLFTDDDCVPAPGWVRALTDGLDEADIVHGPTEPAPEQLPARGPFSRTIDAPDPDRYFRTCNVGYRRSVLERVAGFDESLGWCEDTDLAWRALEHGAEPRFCETALVHHDVSRSSLRRALRETPRWAEVPRMLRRHPGLRQEIHGTYFWRASHLPTVLALTGLLMVTTRDTPLARAVGLGLLAPYVRHRLVIDPLPGVRRRHRLTLLPAAFLVDAAEVAVLTRASIRHHCLVL